MSNVEEKTQLRVLRLLGHREKKLRASSLGEKLKDLPAHEIAALLDCICNKAKGKNPAYLNAYSSLPELLRDIVQAENLHPAVKEAAYDLVKERS